jgi:hypothetical protein
MIQRHQLVGGVNAQSQAIRGFDLLHRSKSFCSGLVTFGTNYVLLISQNRFLAFSGRTQV